jgi:hypothetical protein
MHWTAPGAHTPLQDAVPDVTTHACPVHAAEAPQLPLALQVCTPLPEHCVLLGAQTPLHPPDTHAWLPQSIGAPHCPVALHARTALPAHSVAPWEHAGPPSEASTICGASGGASIVVSGVSPSGTVVESGSVVASMPPPLDELASAASGTWMVVALLPPQDARTVPASKPARAKRIECIESTIRPRGKRAISDGL